MTDTTASTGFAPRCAATNRDGEPCANTALSGSAFCQYHGDAPSDLAPKMKGREPWQVQPGTSSPALTHGLRSKFIQLPPDVQAHLDDFVAGVVSDLGGPDDLTTLEKGYVEKLRLVEQHIYLWMRYIEKAGLNPSTVGTLLQIVDRYDKFAQRLGLQRRQKKVETFLEALAQEPPRE